MAESNARRIESLWYGHSKLAWLLLPLSLLYWLISGLHRWCYSAGVFKRYRSPVPVVVVGNVTAGGAGKTPVVIWLARQLQASGLRPGIISRGYGGERDVDVMPVDADSDPQVAGDEPVLIARSTGFPVQVGADRRAAIEALLSRADIDVIVSDDGLQHYALERDAELVVVDGERLLGNGFLLPAGPLRESATKLQAADAVVFNGGEEAANRFELIPGPLVNLSTGEQRSLESFSGVTVAALAGIGNPQRFYSLLTGAGLQVQPVPADDHQRIPLNALPSDHPVLMTEKDAVKYQPGSEPLQPENLWYLPVRAVFKREEEQALVMKIRSLLRTD